MRITVPALLLGVGLLAGCSSSGSFPFPPPGGPPRPAAVKEKHGPPARRAEHGQKARGPRKLGVPPGHYPPAGQCRVWFPGRPPGQQPRATSCARLAGHVPAGAFVLYGGREWDSLYDWRDHERRHHGSVPGVILEVLVSVHS